MNAQFGELDSELVNVMASTAEGETQAAHDSMREALQLSFELAGDCAALEELSDAIGFRWDDEHEEEEGS